MVGYDFRRRGLEALFTRPDPARRAIKWSFLNGIAIFDFGIGDESYELGFAVVERLEPMLFG